MWQTHATNHEFRFKVVRIRREEILAAFNWQAHATVVLPVLSRLPEGYEILEVRDDWERRCFAFIVYHASFDLVPNGAVIPAFEEEPVQSRFVELRRIDKDEGVIVVEVV